MRHKFYKNNLVSVREKAISKTTFSFVYFWISHFFFLIQFLIMAEKVTINMASSAKGDKQPAKPEGESFLDPAILQAKT